MLLLGFPPDAKTDAEKQTYIDLINETYNCQLQVHEIEHNEAMRNLSKLFLNRLEINIKKITQQSLLQSLGPTRIG